jgi:hypothetical protein
MLNAQSEQKAQHSVQPVNPLSAARLYRPADLGALEFLTTGELAPLGTLASYPRASEAISLGTEMSQRGCNIFAIGASGARIQQSVKAPLEDAARPVHCRPTGCISTISLLPIVPGHSRCLGDGRRASRRRSTI